MPLSPPRACSRPGCAELQPCPVHRHGETYRETITARPHRALYKQARWLRLRRRYLDAHPLCECDYCQHVGRPQPARVVHHRVDHRGDVALFFAWGNLQAMAKACHDRETRRRQLA